MSTHNMQSAKAQITFDRTSQNCYDVFYDRKVLIGNLARRGSSWIFYPTDLDGLSSHTMKQIIDKIEWLDSRITEERVY